MKKNRRLLMLLITLILMFVMTACATDAQTTTEGQTGNQQISNQEANANQDKDKDNKQEEEVVEVIPMVEFSAPAGFYEKEFYLELTAENNYPIYYTLDGSDPANSDTAMEYKEQIRIYNNTQDENVYSAVTGITLHEHYAPGIYVDKGIVIRAAFKDADGNFSAVATNSYFVEKTDSFYNNIRVISMVTDGDYLFDPDTGAYMIGSKYYEWLNSKDYYEMDPGDVNNPTNYNTDGKESEFPVNIQIFENGQSVFSQNVGARICGNWTRGETQKSFRLYARKEYGDGKMRYPFIEGMVDSEGELIAKFDKITLSNGGNDHILHFRDAFIQDLADGLELDIQDSDVCVLFINGEFWGHYLLREKAEDSYIEEKYGIDSKEVVVIKNGELDSGEEEDRNDYAEITRFVQSEDMSKPENYQKFCDEVDVLSFIDYMAVETYVNNSDWAMGYTNNWMVWRSNLIDENLPKADGKWRYILYDLDISSGLYGSTETAYYYDSLNLNEVPYPEYNLPNMLRCLIKNEEFKQLFYDRYNKIIDENFAFNTVNSLLGQYVYKYRNVSEATYARFNADWKIGSYENEVAGLRDFFYQRPKYAKNQLDIFVGKDVEALWAGSYGKVDYESLEGDGNNIVPNVDHWYWWGGMDVSRDKVLNTFYVNQPVKLEDDWRTQLGAGGLTFEQGQNYRVSFDASFDGTGQISYIINRTDDEVNYPTQIISKDTIGKEMAHYEYYFTSEMPTNNDFNFNFNMGLAVGNFEIKNIVIEKVN